MLAYGFARARCGDCHQERLVAFSCKGRGVCPSCTNRRMAEVAAHLRDRVIPRVPVRQWVLSVPKRLRPTLARDPDLAGAVLRILLRVIHRALQDTAGVPLPDEARLGAVSFLHRFGSTLNPDPHFHLAVTDGLFARGHDDALTFHPARWLDADTARSLTPLVQGRILRLYVRRGLLTRSEADDMLRWRGTGGFSLDGSVRVAAHDRAGLERLLRYCARPPFALHRLRHATPGRPLSSPDARLVYHLPRPARDGRTALRLAPLELLDRLARLIPPPRLHRHRYHGAFAPNAAWRKQVVRYERDDTEDTDASDLAPVGGTDPCSHTTDRSPSAARARSR
ncbi:MAG: transposase, partial [Gemmatimonadota bacterium]